MTEEIQRAAGNGKYCSCGRHEGIGMLSAADRAARYQHLKDKLRPYLRAEQAAYLADWIRHHGSVVYDMVESHLADGRFLAKGTPVMAPRNRQIDASPIVSNLSRHVSWHEREYV